MKVLVVDDEKNLRESIAEYLRAEGIQVQEAENGLSGQRRLKEDTFDAAVFDLKMPGLTGLELLEWLKTGGPDVPVVMISAYGEVNDAVQAMKLGARDYLVKPFDPEELLLRLNRLAEEGRLRRLARNAQARPAGRAETGWIGQSPAMQRIRELAAKVAASTTTVLVTGESGTGKEVVAREIHRLSPRADGPFVPINLGGIPDNLLESELFGFERGAFTGADRRKEGLFETARAGTLFLDEAGELPLHLQVKLLRVLQDRRIQRLGGTQPLPVDVRIIAATNRDLEKMVKDGRFREDLYYRLNVIRIHLPPLRERRGDIPSLAGHFLARFSAELGGRRLSFSPAALAALSDYAFPGNVRELENLVERACILCEGESIQPGDLSLAAAEPADPAGAPRRASQPGTVREMERLAVMDALRRWEGNRTKAAEELGISRRTMLNKIKEYGIGGQ